MKNKERDYIFNFVNEGCFDEEVACRQLRALWTAYCLHHNIDADTAEYDNLLLEIWSSVSSSEEDNAYWGDFNSFDRFMAADLI